MNRQVTRYLEGSDSISYRLEQLDTAEMRAWLEEGHTMMQTLKRSLNSDTLDLQTAKEVDRFVMSYHFCEQFNKAWMRAEQANDSLHIRLGDLQKDLNSGAGERSTYAQALKIEEKELEKIREHSWFLDSIYVDYNHAFMQFKPIFERYITQTQP